MLLWRSSGGLEIVDCDELVGAPVASSEMARLRSFPEIGRVELIRHFTLTDADEAFLRKFRTGRNVLGAAVQLCALPWLVTSRMM